MQKDLEIVSMLKIKDNWIDQSDLPPEKAAEIVNKILDQAMNNIGYDRVKAN